VQHQWLLRPARRRDLPRKDLALHRPWRVVVVVVEAALADGDAARVATQGHQLLVEAGRRVLRLVRVDPHRRPDVVVGVGEREGPAARRQVTADVDHGGHASGPRAREHERAVRFEEVTVDVAMGVDEHGSWCHAGRRRSRGDTR